MKPSCTGNFHRVNIMIILLLGIAPPASIDLAYSQKGPWEGKISLEVSGEMKFVKYEDIWLKMVVRNLTDNDIVIPEPRPGVAAGLQLKDESGKDVRPFMWTSVQPQPPPYDSVMIPAHGVREEDLDVAYLNDTSSATAIGVTRLLVGTYRVQASLEGLQSNVFEFSVVGQSAEDLQIYDHLVKLSKGRLDREKAIREARTILNDHPNTVYYVTTYDFLVAEISASKDPSLHADEMIQASLDFMETHQNSGEVKVAIEYFAKGLERKLGVKRNHRATDAQWETIQAKIDELKKKYPSERMTRYFDKNIRDSKKYEKQFK